MIKLLRRRTFVYGTALAHPDGEVHFYDDIYGHDPKLTGALAKANP